MNEAAEISALLSLLARAMVSNRDAVSVTPKQTGTATVFEIKVDPKEVGKLIGVGGPHRPLHAHHSSGDCPRNGKRSKIPIGYQRYTDRHSAWRLTLSG